MNLSVGVLNNRRPSIDRSIHPLSRESRITRPTIFFFKKGGPQSGRKPTTPVNDNRSLSLCSHGQSHLTQQGRPVRCSSSSNRNTGHRRCRYCHYRCRTFPQNKKEKRAFQPGWLVGCILVSEALSQRYVPSSLGETTICCRARTRTRTRDKTNIASIAISIARN